MAADDRLDVETERTYRVVELGREPAALIPRCGGLRRRGEWGLGLRMLRWVGGGDS
jgi:hypothetical protein